MEKYAILNLNNIAENIAIYNQHLENVPVNYILVQDDTMLWHKFENGAWSAESYIPTPASAPITLEELQQNQLTLMDAIATIYEGLSAKGSI